MLLAKELMLQWFEQSRLMSEFRKFYCCYNDKICKIKFITWSKAVYRVPQIWTMDNFIHMTMVQESWWCNWLAEDAQSSYVFCFIQSRLGFNILDFYVHIPQTTTSIMLMHWFHNYGFVSMFFLFLVQIVSLLLIVCF